MAHPPLLLRTHGFVNISVTVMSKRHIMRLSVTGLTDPVAEQGGDGTPKQEGSNGYANSYPRFRQSGKHAPADHRGRRGHRDFGCCCDRFRGGIRRMVAAGNDSRNAQPTGLVRTNSPLLVVRNLAQDHLVAPQALDMRDDQFAGVSMQRNTAMHMMFKMKFAVSF